MRAVASALLKLLRRFSQTEIFVRAGSLAFQTLLSIIPTLGLVFWYLSSIQVTERWLALTRQFVLQQLNVASAGEFLGIFNQLTANISSHSWGWIGLLFLVYTAWSLVVQFANALDAILATAANPRLRQLPGWKLAAQRLVVMVLLPPAITLSLAVTQWIQKDSWLRYLLKLKLVGPYLALPLSWTVGMLTTFLVFYFVPRHVVHWRQALKGAAFVTVAGELTRWGFGLYVQHAVSTQKIYGVFAVIPLFIFWVQVMWLVLLCGALLIRFPQLSPPPPTAPAAG